MHIGVIRSEDVKTRRALKSDKLTYRSVVAREKVGLVDLENRDRDPEEGVEALDEEDVPCADGKDTLQSGRSEVDGERSQDTERTGSEESLNRHWTRQEKGLRSATGPRKSCGPLIRLTAIGEEREEPSKRDGRHLDPVVRHVLIQRRELLTDKVLQDALIRPRACME
jgi:hypothetical protein